jgi:hypothetical protein
MNFELKLKLRAQELRSKLKTFNYLFNECLDYGGVYIIEDIETSYWGENNKKSEIYAI